MEKRLLTDLHIHSTFSDETIPIEEIVRIYGEAGLGLSFVKEVVDLHGGRILVQSEPQKGSIFSILLPIKGNFKAEEMERGHEII